MEVEVVGINGGLFKAFVTDVFEDHVEVVLDSPAGGLSKSKFDFNSVKLPWRNDNDEFTENETIEVYCNLNDLNSSGCRGWWKAVIKMIVSKLYVVEYQVGDELHTELVPLERIRKENTNPCIDRSTFYKIEIDVPDNLDYSRLDNIHKSFLKCIEATLCQLENAPTKNRLVIISKCDYSQKICSILREWHFSCCEEMLHLQKTPSSEICSEETSSFEDLMHLETEIQIQNLTLKKIKEQSYIFKICNVSDEAIQKALSTMDYREEKIEVPRYYIGKFLDKNARCIREIMTKCSVVCVRIDVNNKEKSCTLHEESKVPFVFVGSAESILNIKYFMQYSLAYFKEVESLKKNNLHSKSIDEEMLTHNDLNKLVFETLNKYPSDVISSSAKQLIEFNFEPVSKNLDCLSALVKAIADLTLDHMYTYGPNQKTMAHILEDSEFQLHVTANQRLLSVPLEDRLSSDEPGLDCKLLCLGIPVDVYEDELVQLLNYDTEVYEFRLIMDPMTELSKGIAYITFVQREYAQQARQKLNGFEIRPGKKLKIEDFVDFSHEGNKIHVCTKSSSLEYCYCITEMLDDIALLMKIKKEIESVSSRKRIEEAQKMSKLLYASHSLRMERINIGRNEIDKIFTASDFAVDAMENLSLEKIGLLHTKVCPELKRTKKKKIFRQEDVYINGIYEIPVYPSGYDVVEQEIVSLVESIHESMKCENLADFIIAAVNIKYRFVSTHPFVDGNGRCSRVLFGALLLQRSFPWVMIPVNDSTKYYEALKIGHETDDLTLVYRFFCRSVRKSLLVYLKNLL